MGLFKRAAVRGIATELVRNNVCLFPTKEAMDAAADAVADKMPPAAEGAPPAGLGAEASGPEGHDPAEVAAVANKLIEIAQQLMAEAGGGAGGPPPGAPPGAEGAGGPPMPPGPDAAAAKLGAEHFAKVAASYDYRDLAANAAELLMQKAAEETKTANPQGALIHGGDKENTPSAAAKTDTVAALDQKQRPEGKYHDGAGNTTLESRKGHVGALEQNPMQPHNTPAGGNSLTKDEHKSAMEEQIAKIAEKLIMTGGAHKNTPVAAAKNDGIAALDQKQRPQGKYLVGVGNANIKEEAAARIGKEQPNPVQPGNSPSGTNSVISASKTGSDLSDDEKLYVTLFQKTAEDVGPYLPEKLAQQQKIAAIRHMMGMEHDERQTYITNLHTKISGDVSEMMKNLEHKNEEKKGDHECKGEKCEHESHGSKKEGALLGAITDIANKHTKVAPAA